MLVLVLTTRSHKITTTILTTTIYNLQIVDVQVVPCDKHELKGEKLQVELSASLTTIRWVCAFAVQTGNTLEGSWHATDRMESVHWNLSTRWARVPRREGEGEHSRRWKEFFHRQDDASLRVKYSASCQNSKVIDSPLIAIHRISCPVWSQQRKNPSGISPLNPVAEGWLAREHLKRRGNGCCYLNIFSSSSFL